MVIDGIESPQRENALTHLTYPAALISAAQLQTQDEESQIFGFDSFDFYIGTALEILDSHSSFFAFMNTFSY